MIGFAINFPAAADSHTEWLNNCTHSLTRNQYRTVIVHVFLTVHHLQLGGRRRWAGHGPTSEVAIGPATFMAGQVSWSVYISLLHAWEVYCTDGTIYI